MSKRPVEEAQDDESAIDALTTELCSKLKETNTQLVRDVIKELGTAAASELLAKTEATEATAEGLKTADGERRRTPGGVFLWYAREQLGAPGYTVLCNIDKKRRKLEKKKASSSGGKQAAAAAAAAGESTKKAQSVAEDALDAAVKDATALKKRVFVCLFASFKEDEPAVRWCPDCVEAEPVIDQAFASAAAECHLIKVDITRNSWKVEPGPAHPYRTEPFNAGGIPKLLLLGSDGSVVKGFAEEECKTLDTMKAAFQ